MPFASTPVLPHVDATADVANEDRAPAEVAATTAHAATRPTIVTTTSALRRDRRDDVGFAMSGAACDAMFGATAKAGVLARSILMKMGSGRALVALGWAQGGLPSWFQFQGLSRERISERASEYALFVYCSSIFLGRTRAGVRALEKC